MRHTPPEPSAAPTHEHEWHPIEDLYPVFEDFAAIFHEKCEWEEIIDSHRSKRHDEIFYEVGASCEKTRSFRFDIDKIEDLQTGEVVEEDEIWEGEPTPQAEEWMEELERDDIGLMNFSEGYRRGYFSPEYEDTFKVRHKGRKYIFKKP